MDVCSDVVVSPGAGPGMKGGSRGWCLDGTPWTGSEL